MGFIAVWMALFFLLVPAICAQVLVNEPANLVPGARLAARAGVSLGLPGDPSIFSLHPASLLDVEVPDLVLHHADLHDDLDLPLDELLLAWPLRPDLAIGMGVLRAGAEGLVSLDRDETPDPTRIERFETSDWMITGALARSFLQGRLRTGAAVKLLVRDVDQMGFGTQLDASAVWLPRPGIRLGARLERGLASGIVWEGGRTEISGPDIVLGAGFRRDLSHLGILLDFAVETPGWIVRRPRTTFTTNDVRPWADPLEALRATRIATEAVFGGGLRLRGGFELQAPASAIAFAQGRGDEEIFGRGRGEVALGVGWEFRRRLAFDYGLVLHPDLGPSHRASLAWALRVRPDRGPHRVAPSSPDDGEERSFPVSEVESRPKPEEQFDFEEPPESDFPAEEPPENPAPSAPKTEAVEPSPQSVAPDQAIAPASDVPEFEGTAPLADGPPEVPSPTAPMNDAIEPPPQADVPDPVVAPTGKEPEDAESAPFADEPPEVGPEAMP